MRALARIRRLWEGFKRGMRSTFENICCAMGLFVILGPPVSLLFSYGSHWQFGPYGFPNSLVAEDGRHYLNGDEMDPVTASMARNGSEDDFFGIGISWSCCVGCYSVYRRASDRKYNWIAIDNIRRERKRREGLREPV